MFERPFKGNKYSPVFFVALISIIISFLTRITLLVLFGNSMNVSFVFTISFLIGLLYDIVISSFIVIPLVLQVTFTNNFVYRKKGKLLGISGFAILLFLLLFTNVFPKDYNHELFKWLTFYIIFRFLIYLLLCFVTQKRREMWRAFILHFLVLLSIFLLLFNAVSEVVFWQEFSGRYNFIAVDYLVYTHEVIGNIRESYPVPMIITSVLAITLLCWVIMRRSITTSVTAFLKITKRLIVGAMLLLLPLVFIFAIKPGWVYYSSNTYANELSANGIYQFVQAFQNNELDFYRYYQSMPDSTAFTIVEKELKNEADTFSNDSLFNIERQINPTGTERKLNIVLISVESLSADFMGSFGNDKNLTPQLDSLAKLSLFFTNTYASGTRTVRGLEALSLSIPPTPGQSIVKRPGNENMFSLGSVLRSKGYTTQYIYGGYGYFDNMNYFFGNNGYDVIDRSAIPENEVHYANIWGVADEDLFNLSLKTMDANYSKGKPFFSHIMTVSNHRPFTYPDGRIDIPSANHSREGGVKYTDYAIGNFIKQASKKPWFANTVFVIVADHCASSAGSAYLPVTGYHIPLMIYSPLLSAKTVTALTGQIDIPPMIMGLLNISYKSKFFGRDVLDSTIQKDPHAFISTYQGLGMITNDQLVVQSPLKKLDMYKPDFVTGKAEKIPVVDSLAKKAMAFYQVAAWLVKHKKYSAKP